MNFFSSRLFVLFLIITMSNAVVPPLQAIIEPISVVVGSVVCTTGICAYKVAYTLIKNKYRPERFFTVVGDNKQLISISRKEFVVQAYAATIITIWNLCGALAIGYGINNNE
jgi:hypothetical protein